MFRFCNHFRSVIERNGENSHEDVTIRPIKSWTKCATSSSENEEISEFEIILVFLFIQQLRGLLDSEPLGWNFDLMGICSSLYA